jgi:hypothetical protein
VRFWRVLEPLNENAWIWKRLNFRKRKTGQFQNDPFSENENDLVSALKRKHFSFALYIEGRKGKRSNFTFKSSTSRRRPFYFSPGPSDVEALPPHYNYIIKAGRCKANIDESADELKKYNKWYIQLHIKCYSPLIYKVIVPPIYKTKASVRPIYREEARSSPAESLQPVVAVVSSAFAVVQPSLSPIYRIE